MLDGSGSVDEDDITELSMRYVRDTEGAAVARTFSHLTKWFCCSLKVENGG